MMPMRHVALVLLPGITDCVEQMTPAVAGLAQRGASVIPIVYSDMGAAQSIEGLARSVWQHIDAAHPHAALRGCVLVLIGFSMGSFVAQAMLADVPQALPGGACALALVLVGGAAPGSMHSNAAALGRAFSRFQDAEARGWRPCRAVPLHRGIIAAAYLLTGRRVRMPPGVPVLAVHGSDDDTLPLHNAVDMVHAYGADMHVIPSARHNVFRDAPVHVAVAIADWVSRRATTACVVAMAREMGL
jgi:pimeloyl-ACP methyl ester carboxylesterase